MSKVQHEVVENDGAKIEDCVIVIDDPVSSLDENRLYSTACLVRSKFFDAKQLFVLSHNLVFMKFLGNLMGNKDRSDYFLSNHRGTVCLENLPKGLSNYTTVYFQKLDDIMRFHSGDLAYQEARNFIPNNIRVVLESFLSFKLCTLKHGSSGDSKRIAGLDKLIDILHTNINVYKAFKAVGDINATNIADKLRKIQRVTDPQAHGSPQSIHEFSFISENELKDITEDTLNIIMFLDNIHFQSAQAN